MSKKRIGVYPGTFDPITKGHLDIIKRALTIFKHVRVGVAHNPEKPSGLFTPPERCEMIRESVAEYGDRISVEAFHGLLIDYAREVSAGTIIRGLRAVGVTEDRAWSIIEKVALDCLPLVRRGVLMALAGAGDPLTTAEVAGRAEQPPTPARRALEELLALLHLLGTPKANSCLRCGSYHPTSCVLEEAGHRCPAEESASKRRTRLTGS